MNRFQKQLIQSLISNKNKSIWNLIEENDAHLLKFLEINKSKSKLKINKNKINIIKKINDLNCSICEGRGLIIDGLFNDILIKFKTIIKNRPPALDKFDQAFIKAEDVIKRVEFIYQRGDLLNSKILVIGDDDLLSLALALTKLPQSVYIIEIDQRLTDFINKISKKLNLNIKTLEYDVREPLPKSLINKFDVFVTDPVETERGLKLFLLRGFLSLNKNGSGYFGLTTSESSLAKWFNIEKFILKNGFVITDIKRKFSVYPIVEDEISWKSFEEKLPISKIIKTKANYNWYLSSFIRIEKIKNIKISNKKIKIGTSFYKDKEALATP
ncbi:MAG: hypothetical protein KatS3mg094_246 [Candidatus Parcubacteria bacterium]|nr:MAG: hypothetical protein KatS3mg094_246 [Candidatus Parcubacteria bacterium]